MKGLITWDTETHLFAPGSMAPRMVLMSFSADGAHAGLVHRDDPACYRLLREWLEDDHVTMGCQNAPFDLAVISVQWPDFLPLVFEKLEKDLIVDSMVRQKLIDIAKGVYRGYTDPIHGSVKYEYNLAALAKRHKYPHDLDKDTWRLRYHEFDTTPIDQIPEGARDYASHDALSTYWVIDAQEEDAYFLEDQYRQSRAHWALHLVSCWGIRTDRRLVARYKRLTKERLDRHRDTLLEKKFLVVRKPKKDEDPTRTYYKKEVKLLQEYAERALGALANRTPTGRVKMDEDSAATYASVDPIFQAFQEFGSADTMMKRVEEWESGVDMPIHTRFDELMDTGRTSSSKPNIQNRMAEGADANPRMGDRECIVPRRGNIFYVSDVPGLELRTISQSMLLTIGRSSMAKAINNGEDLHLKVAAQILGISEAEAYKRKKDPTDNEFYMARQTGKVLNFGANAGAGEKKIMMEARTKYGMDRPLSDWKKWLAAWHDTWEGDFRVFFKWVNGLLAGSGHATIFHYGSNRYRGYLTYTQLCNTFSQGMGSDATKAALYALIRECYIGEGLLLGSRVVNYPHDEYILEGPDDDLRVARAGDMARVIVTEANKWLPDVPIPEDEMKPVLCRRWSKLAKALPDGKVWEWDVAVSEGSPGYAE